MEDAMAILSKVQGRRAAEATAALAREARVLRRSPLPHHPEDAAEIEATVARREAAA